MKVHPKYKRFFVSSVLGFLFFGVVGFIFQRTTEAENQSPPSYLGKQSFRSVVPYNSAKINFVRGARVSADDPATDLQQGKIDVSLRPLSLASGDLNADGFPDLICGYGTSQGGMVVIHYGDPRAYAPTDQADIDAIVQGRYPSPFRGSTSIQLDHAPEFLFTGDFDRDSRRDILTAAGGGSSFTVLTTKGNGFGRARVDLSEQITSVVVAEGYSADGFADVYIGTGNGWLLGYEEMESFLDQQPKVYSLPGVADSIAIGRFDDGTTADFAVIVAGQLYVVHGEEGRTERINVPFTANAIAASDFIWDRNSQMELAVADENGATAILSRGELDTRPMTSNELEGRRQYVADIRDGKRRAPALVARKNTRSVATWRIAEDPSADVSTDGPKASTLAPMLASGQRSVDLLSMDMPQRRLSISYRTDGLTSNTGDVVRETVSFPTDGEPVAVLPMRLNIHSRPSLVVFEKGSIEPSLLLVTPEATFPVTKTADTNDGACNADCSLREAVIAANAAAGLDMITFAINGNFQLTLAGDDNTSALGDLDVNSDISFVGNGQASTFIQGSSDAAFTGNIGDKAIGINQDGTFTTLNVSLQNLTIRFTRNDIAVNPAFTQTGGAMDIFLTGTGAMPGPTTTLTNVTFDSNANAHSYGGALNIDSGDLGGGTGVFRGTVSITGSTISNNDTLTVSLADNPPTGGGVNMFSDIHNVTISSSVITGNQTSALLSANGGGINIRHSFGGTITINNNTSITNNTAGSDGGGIQTAFNQTLGITGGSITGNTAQGSGDSGTGGGLFNGSNISAPTTLTNVAVSNNIATAGGAGAGGGIADGANSALNISGCTITGNQADNGGGIAKVSSGGTTTVSNSNSISGNTATISGSAVHISSGLLAFSDTHTVSGNIDVATNPTAELTLNTGSTTNLTGDLTMSNGVITSNNAAFNITGSYSQSGGTFNGNTSTWNISNGSSLSGGTFNAGGTYNVTGSFTQSGGTYNGGGTMSITGAGNFNKSNGTFNGGSGTINLIGNFSHSGGTFSGGTGTFNFNGSGAQSVSALVLPTFNHLSDANVTQPLTINNNINVNGSLTANGVNTILAPVATAVIGGTGTLTGTGTARVTRVTGTNDFLTQYTITNKTLTNLLIDYVGAAAQGISGTTYTNVRLNNSAGGTLSAPATVNGTLTLASGAFNVGTSTLTLNDGVTVIGGSLTSGATGTVIYNQTSNGQQVVAGQYGNLTFSNFNKSLPGGTVSIAGTFTPGSGVHTVTGNTINFNGTAAQTIPVFPYNNLTLGNAAGASLGGNVTVNGNLALTTGVLSVGTSTLTINNGTSVGTGSITSGATGTVIYNQGSDGQVVLPGNYGNLSFSNFNKVLPATVVGIEGTFTSGTATGHTITGNTINFNGAGGQTIPAFTYNNLTSSNIGARILSGAGTIGIAGAFTPGTNVYTIAGSTVEFNGISLQTLPASFTTYQNLTVNNAAGLNLSGNVSVNGILNFLGGNINTGTNTLTVAAGGSASRTSGHVLGNLQKIFGSTGPFTYFVGTPGEFSPVGVVVTAGTGSLSVLAVDGIVPATPPLSANSLQRYWTLDGTGITADVTFNYLQSDVVGLELAYNTVRVTGTTATIFSNQCPSGAFCVNTVANTITARGLTSFSNWSATQVIPTAAEVSVSGRVTTQAGRGIGGVRMILRDAEGHALNATTNTFGFYRFDNVEAGKTYILTPLAKQYRFTERVLVVDDNMEGVDFVPDS